MTKVVSIKMNPALLLRIDGLTSNLSDFIRAAVEEKVKRAGAKGKSTWDVLAKTGGLDITIPKAADQVKRTDLCRGEDLRPLEGTAIADAAVNPRRGFLTGALPPEFNAKAQRREDATKGRRA
jgi:hypothetical protein